MMKIVSENLKKEYNERLKRIAKKKMQTTMIYPLSQFEMVFGHFWGHGKSEDQLTEDEKMFREKWDTCRNNILDNGNRQIRNLLSEITRYDVVWKRYQMELVPKENI